jgi:peptidoglycan/xylan/chitin deacetylase (PgdA/CDA1 family)
MARLAILKVMRIILALVLCFLANTSGAQNRTVAITFDDLPLAQAGSPANVTPAERLTETRNVNLAILNGLKKHHAWAIGFVNEKKVTDGGADQNRAILQQWIRFGNDLGNHTFAHLDLSKISAEEFEREVVDGEASVKSLMAGAGKPVSYLRFPYNHTGETAEKHAKVAAFLKKHGYDVATCTVDNSDWAFARAYRLMLERKDEAAAERLRTAYIEYTGRELEYYSQLHKQIFGHEIPHVMLLHANRLNADTIDDVLGVFEKAEYRFVTLRQAQSDPAYKTPAALTSDGPMWGYRWARTLNIKVDGSREPEVPAWVAEYK